VFQARSPSPIYLGGAGSMEISGAEHTLGAEMLTLLCIS